MTGGLVATGRLRSRSVAAPRADPVAAGAGLPAPVQRAAWRDLPPLKPVLTTTPPVAPLDSFTASLATARNPSFLAPLSHVVDPDGPSGQVDGLASPVTPATTTAGPELVVGPSPSPLGQVVQRIRTPRTWLSPAAPVGNPAAQCRRR